MKIVYRLLFDLVFRRMDPERAHELARILVTERLAGCVNVVGGLHSVYRWDGDVAEDPESLLIIKTTGERYPELEARVRSVHPYEVPEIIDIRGPGLMNAVEFNVAGTDKPSPDFTNKVREEALSRGLILLTCGVYGNVIRFLPPLTVPDAVFDEALDILEASVRAARGAGGKAPAIDGNAGPGQQEA